MEEQKQDEYKDLEMKEVEEARECKKHGSIGKPKSDAWKKNHALKMKEAWAKKKNTGTKTQ